MSEIRDPYDRLLERTIILESGCWEVQGKLTFRGYSRVSDVSRTAGEVRGHRISYERNVGPIPAGLTVHHVCRNRACINPDHLELRTNEDNAADNGWAMKEVCPQGHAYDDENTYVTKDGRRVCKTCNRDRNREFMRIKRARQKVRPEQ